MPETHLLTGAYALDALDDIERAGFERHLAGCDTCPAEVADFREATAGLADRVATAPPPGLRAAVLAEVARTRQVTTSTRPSRVRPSLRRTLAAAAASVLVAAGAALGGIAWEGQRAADQATVAAERSQARSAEILTVLRDPNRTQTSGPSAIGGTATVYASGGRAVLAADGLPTPARDRAFQVWVIDGDVIRSVELLRLDGGSGQALAQGVRAGSTVAVSLEPAGGSRQPTTTPFIAVKVA